MLQCLNDSNALLVIILYFVRDLVVVHATLQCVQYEPCPRILHFIFRAAVLQTLLQSGRNFAFPLWLIPAQGLVYTLYTLDYIGRF